MEEISTSLQAAGIVLSSEKLRGALLSFSKQGPVIDQVFECNVVLKVPETTEVPSEDVKPLYTLEQELPHEFNDSYILVTGISSSHVIIRPLNLKLQKLSEIEAVLPFQAEPLLPYPIEEALLDSQILSSSKAGSQLNLQAIRKDHLRDHLLPFTELNLEPEVVTSTPTALAVFGQVYAFSSSNPYYVIHIDEEESICLMGKEGKLLGSFTIHYGYASLERKSMLSCANYLHLKKNIAHAVTALAKQNKKIKGSEVLICGLGSLLPELSEDLAEHLKLKLKLPTHSDEVELNKILSFSLPIALALCALPTVSTQVNFRQKEYSYPHPWKRWKQPLSIYLALCCLIALLIFFLGNTWTQVKENELRNQYAQLLENTGKSYSSFELSFQKEKMGNKNPNEDDVIPPEKLSRNELLARVLYLQTEVASAPDIFPLLPTVPRVSDLIAWLSLHPKIINANKENQIEILSLQYVMVKRPTQKKKNEPYQVRVDLEFTTPIPMIARELHDALIEPNEMVDPKGEVKWSSSRDRYKASFFLRGKKLVKEGS